MPVPVPVMVVYGTRPEGIKLAPIVKSLEASALFEATVAVTGQHRAMLDQVNAGFGIVPAVDLDVFEAGQSPTQIAAKTLTRLEAALAERRPAAVLVQGDTTSALAAALAAFYAKIPVVHVEAGLRTETLWSPFPEEGNRRALTQLASLHLAPTRRNADNLLACGVAAGAIAVTGNTVIDALLAARDIPHEVADPRVAALLASPRPLVLVTSHRRESWGEPMARTARALARLAAQEPETGFLFPLHANPLVRDIFRPALGGFPNVVLTEPLDYLDLAKAMAGARIIVTDSGGIQEEGPSLGKPVLVLRDETERPEGVAAGTARLVGTDEAKIVAAVTELLHDPAAHAAMAEAVNPYGDGRAAQRSTAALAKFFGIGPGMEDFSPAPSRPPIEEA
jgi:UDP-N-acetylglucosamine 2-epimerase (non-hydrolysing)